MFDEFDNQEAEVQLETKIEEKKEQEIQPEDEKAGLQLQEESLKPASIPFGHLLLWSFIASFFSVANPLFTSLATNLQTQNLYAGWAMTQGQAAYGQFYGTSGMLYYVIAWLGNLFMGSLLFAVLQFLALFIAGIFLFQFIYQMTGKKVLAQQLLPLFYFLVITLGFGGLYASIFVLPFVMWSLNFLAHYVNDQVGDNGFILLGAIGALAFMVDPFTSIVFYGLVFLVWTIFHIARKRLARGFYQFLASLLGFSLVFYPLGYYTVWKGTFGVAISQVTYSFESLGLQVSDLPTLLIMGGLFIGLGFLTALVMGLVSSVDKNAKPFRYLGGLGILTLLLVNIFLPSQGNFQLLPMIPFVMILLAIWFNKNFSEGRHTRKRRTPSIWKNYFVGNLFLPVLAMAFLVASPVVQRYLLAGEEEAERAVVSKYIREESAKNDKIYAWDSTASLYQSTGRLSAATILSPKLYLDTEENKILLGNQLDANLPRYIVVNKKVPLLGKVKKIISSNYKKIGLDTSQFKLYELK
ncbi:MAG: heme transporter CcmD [Streptococcus gordonii]|nr:heme transporter CcmD [Streptococcus gordonii]